MVIPPGRKPRKVLSGPFHGIAMNLSLQSQSQVYLGLFERETHSWLVRLSRGIQTAIDIGAAHGEYTLFFLTRTNAIKVLAFEPDQTCWSLFQENIKLNAAADWNEHSRLELSGTLLGSSNGQNTITLDSIIMSVQAPCLIKMDVDGAEVDILKGAMALNALSDVRWLIETHSKSLEKQSIEVLRLAGFETEIIPNAWWRLLIPELRPIEQNRWLAAWKKTAK